MYRAQQLVKKMCGYKPKNPEFMTALLLFTQADPNKTADQLLKKGVSNTPTIIHLQNSSKSISTCHISLSYA